MLPELFCSVLLMVSAIAEYDFFSPNSPDLCISAVNQSKTTWCFLNSNSEGLMNSPYEDGNCMPYFGIWINDKFYTPSGKIQLKRVSLPVPESHQSLQPKFGTNPAQDSGEISIETKAEMAEGFQMAGYFKASCSGDKSEVCKNVPGVDCNFKSGLDDALLLRVWFWGEVDCKEKEDKDRFKVCPIFDSGCLKASFSKYYEWLYGDFSFTSGRRFWLEHNFSSANLPTSPVQVGIGANGMNLNFGVGIDFRAHSTDNNEIVEGKIRFDVDLCEKIEDVEAEVPLCSGLTLDEDKFLELPNQDTGLCAYEYNSGSIQSNHILYIRKDKRSMVPDYNLVTKVSKWIPKNSNADSNSQTGFLREGLHPAYDSLTSTSITERALKVKTIVSGIDGEISFIGTLMDIANISYKLDLYLKAKRARKYESCEDSGVGHMEHVRLEPYACPNPLKTNKLVNAESWEFYGQIWGFIQVHIDKSEISIDDGIFKSKGKCWLNIQDQWSPQYGFEASGRNQPFTQGKDGFAMWGRFATCSGSLSYLEGTPFEMNCVVDDCQTAPVKVVPCNNLLIPNGGI